MADVLAGGDIADRIKAFHDAVDGEVEKRLLALPSHKRLAVSAPQLEEATIKVHIAELDMAEDPPAMTGGWRIYTPPARMNFWYRNHRDEEGGRTVIFPSIRHGSTLYYPEPQWLLTAFDLDRMAWRTFALGRCKGFWHE